MSATATEPATNGHRTNELVPLPRPSEGAIAVFANQTNFESAQRMAKALCSSTLVPEQYRGEKGLPNCLIAMELAGRTGASVLMVMQNLYIVHGKPGWAATFLIAGVNQSGRFTPLRFQWDGKKGTDDWQCICVAKDKDSGEVCTGAAITIRLAKAEGWFGRKDSKWQTMPEQMMMYRAAAWWTRVYAPEVSLGMLTADEVEELPPPAITISELPVGRKSIRAPKVEAKVDDPPPPVVQDETPAQNTTFGDADESQEPPEEREPLAPEVEERLTDLIDDTRQTTSKAKLASLLERAQAMKEDIGVGLFDKYVREHYEVRKQALGR